MPAKKTVNAKEGELIKATGPGRKTLYKPEYKDELIDFMRQGKSIIQIAAAWNVSRYTVHKWLKENDELKEAYDVAKAQGEAYWQELGNVAMVGQIKGFNTKIYEMNMRNRFGWGKEDNNTTQQIINIENMNISKLSEEQIDSRIKALIDEVKTLDEEIKDDEQSSKDTED